MENKRVIMFEICHKVNVILFKMTFKNPKVFLEVWRRARKPGGTYSSSSHDIYRNDRLHLLCSFSQDDQSSL